MRKNLLIIAVSAICSLILGSCGGGGITNKVTSQGPPYEIVVVCTQDKWSGALGDTLRSIMQEQVAYINDKEPIFDVLRILPNAFKDILQKHRNVLLVRTGTDYAEPKMTATYDTYAKPQIVVTVSAPNDASLTDYISKHRYELQEIFNITERERFLAQSKQNSDKAIEELIKTKFGFDVSLIKGYKVRDAKEDFVWLSYEYPEASQGVVIYSYPYADKKDFTMERLVERRDQFVSLIPAENPGSHMITFRDLVPEVKHQRIYGRFWAEMRGFWDVKNDFMGGPFVSFSTLDSENKRVVTIDCYVFSPSPYKHKRNLLRQLENIVYSVSFPGDREAAKRNQ